MDVIIRNWRMSDLDNLVRYANNRNISDHLSDAFPYPYTAEFGTRFIERVSREQPMRVFAITIDDNAIGSIGVFPDTDIHRLNGAIAYWVAEPYWGRGIASTAIPMIVDYAFRNLGLQRVYAKPFGYNKASHRVLEKCGFEFEAVLKNTIVKQGKITDEMIYSIRKTDR